MRSAQQPLTLDQQTLESREDSNVTLTYSSNSANGLLGKRSSDDKKSIDRLKREINDCEDDTGSDDDDQFGDDGDKRERRYVI